MSSTTLSSNKVNPLRVFTFLIFAALLSFAQPNIVRIPLGEDVASIMRSVPAGATFEFEAGVHRTGNLPVESGDVLQSDGGAVLSGADGFAWTDLGDNTYSIVWLFNWGLWPIPANWPAMTDTVRRREVLWVNGVRLRQILNCVGLSLEQFCVNEAADTITFRTARPIERVEAAVRSQLISVSNVSNVTIRGLTFTGTASNYDSSAVLFVNSSNITVEDSTFTEHNGGGLGIVSTSNATANERSQNITVRNSRFLNNGGTGLGLSRIQGLTVSDITANSSNWRGGWGGFVNWSAAGIKVLYIRNGTFSRIVTNDTQSHGLWLDTDIQNVSITNLQSNNNLKYGLFLEALTGQVDVSASHLEGNQIGVFSGNTSNVSLTDITLVNNQIAVLIGGDAIGRPVKDFITGANYSVPPAANWRLTRVSVTGKGIPFRHGTGAFDTYRTTLTADFNNWWREGSTTPFEVLSEKLSLAQWQSRTSQDLNSTSLNAIPIPFTPTPTITPTNIPTLTATPTVTTTPTPTIEPTTNAETATPTPEMQTATPNFVWRFEIVIKGWKE